MNANLNCQALFGLRRDLGLDVGDRFSWCASIFYLGFLVGAYPVMLLAQRYPVERVASAIVTLWGVCLISTTACTNYQGIFAQRFFLGMLEVGISPMFMLIVGSWYKKDEQAMRMGSVNTQCHFCTSSLLSSFPSPFYFRCYFSLLKCE